MRTLLVVTVVLSVLFVFPVQHALAQPAVGIYTDASGTSCTLSDQAPGVVNLYVVARHDASSGVRGIQFMAPKPACFTGTFVADLEAPGTATIGASQTGISVTLPYCSSTPVHMLTIQYYGYGTTPACCEFPILPDPTAGGSVLIADCSYTEVAATGLVSRINADASCPCTGNSPPLAPTYPSPPNLSTFEPIDVDLAWSSFDPDGHALEYDLYFGDSSPAPLLAANLEADTYDPGTLVRGTQYYWRVLVRDSEGAETSGPEWTFSTAGNYAPTVPSSPNPGHGFANVSVNVSITWECLDFDGDPLTYDVYFGTASNPPLAAAGIATNSYTPGTLAYSTFYYWRIVAHDDHGGSNAGPVWLFQTGIPNMAPYTPHSAYPANGQTGRPINVVLTWQSNDPNSDPLVHDVYFGTVNPPPLAVSGMASDSYVPGTLSLATPYYWRVVARDPEGLETSGPVWTFTTSSYTPPNAPVALAPAHNAIVVPGNINLAWSALDPDGQALTHDVYFGAVNPPPLVASGLVTPTYAPGPVDDGVTYYWRVVVSDGTTAVSGPVWAFLATDAAAAGDVTGDGILTVEDADCALNIYGGISSCAGAGGPLVADVDCSGVVTPRDARCIHQRVVGAMCPLCGGAAAAPEPNPATPFVHLARMWWDGYLLHAVLGLGGSVPNLNAFGFRLTPSANVFFLSASAYGATTQFTRLGSYATGGGIVGGYDLEGVASPGEFIHLTFFAITQDFTIAVHSFVDDLAGAETLVIDDSGPPLPVLFAMFDAAATDGGVQVKWKLSADEAMESYTLYRREGDSPMPLSIAQGPVEDAEGSYLDRAVEPGHDYHYELVIRTAGGDEFRSPVATARTRELALALHQNHPNPFNPQTTIRYDVPGGGSRVHLAIYDLQGGVVRTLVNAQQAAGSYAVDWNAVDDGGNRVASGVYFYVLDAGRERLTRKLVLLK